jgi:hypothetical protein
MSNRLTKGVGRVGSIALDSSGGVLFDRDRAKRCIKVLTFTGASTTEVDTSFDLPTSAIVHDIWAEVTTASTAAGTLTAGTLSSESGGDADGFIVSIGTSSTGILYPTFTHTEATSGDIITGNKRGVLLSAHATGTTDLGSWGFYAQKAYRTDSATAKSVSYTLNSTSGTAGNIYIEYTEI